MIGHRNRRGDRVLRVGQTADRLIGVMLVIVIAAAIGFIGTDVTAEIEDSTGESLDGEDVTVINESFSTSAASYPVDYQVNDAGRAASFDDDERVFNTSGSSDSELTEATDYEWFTNNGTVRIFNTSATQDPGGDPNGTYSVTYNYTEQSTNFADAQRNISGGYVDAMGLTDVVFIVLMFSVILGALLMFRQRA